MYSSYKMKADDLDDTFINAIKSIFKNKEIEIIVYDHDEIEYLLASDANKTQLFQAIKNVKKNKNLIEVTINKLQ